MNVISFFTPVRTVTCVLIFILMSCSSSGTKKDPQMKPSFSKGSYGYDVDFLTRNNFKFIELKDQEGIARILIVPDLQGRVMTSSANGREGKSFGWINYSYIESGKKNDQFNPFGGEERLWLGPEGGDYSIYFKEGSEQVFSNWQVPKELDTEPFDIISQNTHSISFKKAFSLVNASGTSMQIGLERKVSLMSSKEVGNALKLNIDDSLKLVAYESYNTLINQGESAWNAQSGFLSLWLLSMFNPSSEGVVCIPIRMGPESELGKLVNDEYFGKVPVDRLKISEDAILFKTDGAYRSKIGVSSRRALQWSLAYDPANKALTLLWYSDPEQDGPYVNSKWGKQDDPLVGDVINSYNDGPTEDGSVMGPFFEIESSSPAAMLAPGERLTHIQRIFHFTGNEDKLNEITLHLANTSIDELKGAFK